MVKVVADLVSVEDNFPDGWTGPSVRVGTGHVARGEGALLDLLHKDTHLFARAPPCDLLAPKDSSSHTKFGEDTGVQSTCLHPLCIFTLISAARLRNPERRDKAEVVEAHPKCLFVLPPEHSGTDTGSCCKVHR